VYRGHAQIKDAWRVWLDAWEEWVLQIVEVTEIAPGTVLVVTQVRAHGQGSGVPVRAGGASLWTVRAGQIARAKIFQSKEDALAAAGQRPSHSTGGP
jgi:hypothetical protein